MAEKRQGFFLTTFIPQVSTIPCRGMFFSNQKIAVYTVERYQEVWERVSFWHQEAHFSDLRRLHFLLEVPWEIVIFVCIYSISCLFCYFYVIVIVLLLLLFVCLFLSFLFFFNTKRFHTQRKIEQNLLVYELPKQAIIMNESRSHNN